MTGKKQTPTPFKEKDDLHEAYLLLKDGEVRDMDGNMLSDKTVVEFYYNMTPGIPNKFRWVPMRTRYDKTEAVVQTGTRVVSDTGWYDPLAQTFLVDIDGGAFITDVDLFFSQVDPSVPVKIQIRNVVNGYPGGNILPFSEVVKRPSDVAVSANATAATNFKFRSPVYLQNGVEYAIVVISDSAKYKIWLAQCGEVDINGSGLISQQPYAGVLFKSQNASTWTADQNSDMMFRLFRYQFSTTPATAKFLVNYPSSNVVYDLVHMITSRVCLAILWWAKFPPVALVILLFC